MVPSLSRSGDGWRTPSIGLTEPSWSSRGSWLLPPCPRVSASLRSCRVRVLRGVRRYLLLHALDPRLAGSKLPSDDWRRHPSRQQSLRQNALFLPRCCVSRSTCFSHNCLHAKDSLSQRAELDYWAKEEQMGIYKE